MASPPRAGCPQLALDLERDVDELVFLSADELALTRPVQQLVSGHAVALGLADGVLEEAGVHPGVAHDQCVAVQQALGGHRRGDHLFGGVGDVEEVDPGLDTDLVEHPDQRLHRSVARTGTEPAARPVDLLGARAHRLDRVRHSETEVLVAVETDLGVVTEFGHQRRDPVGDRVEHQRTGRIHHVDALAAGVGHDAGLGGQLLRRDRVAHHQEADRFQPEFTGQPEVLDRHVGLGAVGGDPADLAAVVLRLLDVLLGAHTRQHQEGDLGFLRGLGRELDQFLLRGFGEPVVEARSTQPVTVGDLDDRHSRGVERRDDGAALRRW